jgi:uncharacterized protein YijF (DUF1287 family)
VPVLAKNSKALVEAYQAYRNDMNFKAAFDRDEKVQYMKKQEGELTPGDMVTWISSNKSAGKGLLVKINIKGGVKMSAVVDTGGQREKVQYNALHQLAAKRPQMLLDLDVRLDEVMMAFWRCECL